MIIHEQLVKPTSTKKNNLIKLKHFYIKKFATHIYNLYHKHDIK